MEQPSLFVGVPQAAAKACLTIILPVLDPLDALMAQWERQAVALDKLNAALPLGSIGAQQAAALLRENIRELQAAIVQKGGC